MGVCRLPGMECVSHRVEGHSAGNTVCGIVIASCGGRWELHSPCCTPETPVTLGIDCTSEQSGK